MRNLEVYIECNGNMINVGSITGHNSDDAVFSYSEEYIEDKSSRSISISLPLDERSFSPERTRCFLKVFYQKDIQEGVLWVGFMLMKMIIYQFFQN